MQPVKLQVFLKWIIVHWHGRDHVTTTKMYVSGQIQDRNTSLPSFWWNSSTLLTTYLDHLPAFPFSQIECRKTSETEPEYHLLTWAWAHHWVYHLNLSKPNSKVPLAESFEVCYQWALLNVQIITLLFTFTAHMYIYPSVSNMWVTLYAYHGPHIWNSLPRDIRHRSTLPSFKTKLKTFPFSQYFDSN